MSESRPMLTDQAPLIEPPPVVTAPKTSARTITADLMARLQRHYIKPGQDLAGGIFVPEVGWNAAGSSRCDAIYVGFTGTSGRMMIGHEVKASRSDWLNELKKPGKADAWADECHAWYVVAPSTAVVKPEELPPGWGLLLPGPSKTRMKTEVHATVHHARPPSWDAVRSVMARQDTLRMQTIYEARMKARDEARKDVEEQVANRVARATGTDVADSLRSQRDALIAALGVKEVQFYDGPSFAREDTLSISEIREAAAFLRGHRDLAHAIENLVGRYGIASDRLADRVGDLTTALDALRGLVTAPQNDEAGVA